MLLLGTTWIRAVRVADQQVALRPAQLQYGYHCSAAKHLTNAMIHQELAPMAGTSKQFHFALLH